MNFKRALLLTLAMFFLSVIAAEAAGRWLHVRVEEGDKAEAVRVNVPVSLVETVLPLVEKEELQQGAIRFESHELSVAEIREIWQQIKSQGDYELASVASEDTKVRIAIEGDQVFVRTTEGSDTEVHVNLPVQVVDALLSGQDDQLDIAAAVSALANSDVGELVRVRDGETFVRVWIDENSSSE